MPEKRPEFEKFRYLCNKNGIIVRSRRRNWFSFQKRLIARSHEHSQPSLESILKNKR